MTIRINKLEMAWTDDGCVAVASGFSGVMLTCPRCQALLPRDAEHRCGDEVLPLQKPKSSSRSKPKPLAKGEALLRRRIAQKRGKR